MEYERSKTLKLSFDIARSEVKTFYKKLQYEHDEAFDKFKRICGMKNQIPEHTDYESELETAFSDVQTAYERLKFFEMIYNIE